MSVKQIKTIAFGGAVIAVTLAFACGTTSSDVIPTPTVEAPPNETSTLEPQPTVAPTQTATTPATSPTPRPTVAPDPTPTTAPPPPTVVDVSEPPERDLVDLARRLKPATTTSISRSPAGPLQVGHSETFFVTDPVDGTSYTITATVQVVGEHAYFYVDDNLDVSLPGLERAAEAYDNSIYPTVKEFFGDIQNPGVDGDPRLTILHTALRGAAGYYSAQDGYTRDTHAQSNEREIVYMEGRRMVPGSADYLGVLTHELQHAVHWNLDHGEGAWINEGLSEVAKEIAGYSASFINTFLTRPNTQLNYWPDEIGTTLPSYGAATLFMKYLSLHYGGPEGLKALVEEPLDGVDAFLSQYGTNFESVFADWVVANYVNADEGLYGYGGANHRVGGFDYVRDYGQKTGEMAQLSAKYFVVDLDEGEALVRFEGDTVAQQVATSCFSGSYCWWGNRGDSIDTTLTHRFDLTSVDTATLVFKLWFSIEEGWDYGYVTVSTDDGETWVTLPGAHTTTDNPVGNSYGHGYTDASDGWVEERIDLSPYTGRDVLIRFEYITDDAAYRDGFVVDDISVPELDFFDDAESNQGWEAQGFVLTDTVLPQSYSVTVVEQRDEGVTIREMVLDQSNSGEMVLEGFGEDLNSAVVIAASTTHLTHQPAGYSLTVSQP